MHLTFLTLSLFFTTTQCFAPSPAPGNAGFIAMPPELSGWPSADFGGKTRLLSPSPSPAPAPRMVAPDGEAETEKIVRWCVVGDALVGCAEVVSLFEAVEGYKWKCVKRGTTQECLQSIKKGEADLINLEAGQAYTAFINYSMKAIANEVYCNHAKSYDAVAIVNRKSCKEGVGLMNFKGKKSCHGGYSTAAGWNYPINQIRKLIDITGMDDEDISDTFFSQVCAPSDFEGLGICSGCGDKNGSCHAKSLYDGHSGAFRCLMEELGDIAFMKADTALLYSKEGPYNESWSTKSVRDFMYLCPQGGCREINGYPGSCSFGAIPANVIMASNSIPNKKQSLIVRMLTNATWLDALHGKELSSGQLISPSTQELAVVKNLTRTYLGKSALISQSLQELSIPKDKVIPSTSGTCPQSSSRYLLQWIISFLSISVVFTTTSFVL